jgi:germacradienol/geosmin synthase
MVVQNFLGCDRDKALGLVDDLMTARMQQFEQLVAVDLPTLFTDFGLDDEVQRTLLGYAEELQNWMSGILVWHAGVDRYKEPALLARAGEPVKRLRVLGGATGFGTSAARLPRPRHLVGASRMDGVS